MMSFGGRVFVFAVVYSVLLSAVSFADNSADSSFSITPNASFLLLSLPEYAPVVFYDMNISERIHNIATEDGFMTGLKYGVAMGWDTPFTFSNHRIFFEASTYYSRLSHEQSQLIDQRTSNAGTAWFQIDGSGSRNFFFPATQYISAVSKRDVTQFGGELLIGLEGISWANDATLSPFIGYSTMHVDQDFHTFSRNYAGANDYDMNLDESVTGRYNGVVGGVRLDYARDNLAWHYSASMGAHHVAARYTGSQRIRQIGVTSNTYTGSDTADRISFQGKIKTGIAYLLRDWELGVEAEFEYNSAVPSIDTGQRLEPSHIAWGNSVAGDVGLSLSCEF